MIMFYKFNAHRAKKPEIQDTSTDRLAKKIAGRITSVQHRWAIFMDKYARKLPAKRLKVVLLVLILGPGAYCVHLVGGGIFSKSTSRFADFKFEKLWPFDPLGNKEELRRAADLNYYLDSLEQQVKRDSLQNPSYYQPYTPKDH
jgi:hypothetical protein